MKKTTILDPLTMAIVLSLGTPALAAGPNDFFGGSVPDAVNEAAANAPAVAGGDYTQDEKRMQKKYQSSLKRAKELVAKGDDMMKKGEARHDDKMLKRGKIFKEIGEKQLSELNTNNPFPEKTKDKKSKAAANSGS